MRAVATAASPAHSIGRAEAPLHFGGALLLDVSVAVQVVLPHSHELAPLVHGCIGRDEGESAVMKVPPGLVDAAGLIGADDDVAGVLLAHLPHVFVANGAVLIDVA